jgi:AcrR family transcriptional regulator
VSATRVDALIDAAETEFAEAGFEAASLRKIMRDAGVDPGAIHYHFGDREALAREVLHRILTPINHRRLELLDQVIATGEAGVAPLVEALVRPDVETAHLLHSRSPGRARLIGAIYLHPADFVDATVAAHFAPVADAFRPHLESALPHVPFPVIAWRVRWCVFGTVGALLADASAAFDRPADALLAELVPTLAAALAA